MNFQDLVLTLQKYWSDRGCLVAQPYDVEKGAATFNPATFLRALGPEPWNAAWIEPCRRPKDGRYGDNPNRGQHYFQFQVVLKPSPLDIVDQYLGSLRAIGIDPDRHDIRFVHDDWESPTLGAWGLGWEVWLDGMEITQFTYFQQVGGLDLKPVMGEITYGLERICMYLQKKNSMFELRYNDAVTYGDVYRQNEYQFSVHNFERSDAALHYDLFDRFEKECLRLCEAGIPAPAFDYCMKASHSFNLLDARGAISVNERQGYILRVRALAKAVAEAWLANRETLGFPMAKTVPGSAGAVPAVPPTTPDAGSSTAPLLIELGVEEMPARVFGPLMEQLPRLVEKHLGASGLEPRDIRIFATPRRIAITAASIRTRQPDQKLSLRGAPEKVAKDSAGNWTQAALAFAKKNGIDAGSLGIRDGYLVAEVEKKGRDAQEILAEAIPALFSGIHWYKTMKWGAGEGESFVRPVTWLVALLGERVIPAAFAGVAAGGRTRGHRFLKNEWIPVSADRAGYLDALRKAHVLADQRERKDRIRELTLETAKQAGLAWRADEDLLDTVTWLTEWAVPVLCSFDESLLAIPEEVLVSEMREHQKLFALTGPDGRLANRFVAISNMEAKDGDYGLIREGNERVVRARFADAEFFLAEDRKKTLAERREELKNVAFLKDLGPGASIHAKTERVERLAVELAAKLGWNADRQETVRRIASLCKNDLVTQMVGEFPELQGTVGRYYALAEGLPQPVADGILDHYLPRNAEDGYPATEEGALVGLADRLDTLVALFGKGKIPTGSADPFALRRAGWTTIALLLNKDIRLDLLAMIRLSLIQFPEQELSTKDRQGLDDRLLPFFRDRTRNLFAETGRPGLPGGIAPDTFDAAAGAKSPWWTDVPGFVSRLQALQAFRDRAEFAQIAETFKRVNNILRDAPEGGWDPEALSLPVEKALASAAAQARTAVTSAAENQAWDQALSAIAALQAPVSAFFTGVMVNDPDPKVRRNRLGLIREVRRIVLTVADFSAFQG